jgi:torulene dioxygenase
VSDIKQSQDAIIICLEHVLKLSFFEWARRIVTRFDKLVIRPISPSSKKPDEAPVGVTASPNFPLPRQMNKLSENENVLVAKTDANFLQKINAETLGKERFRSISTINNNKKKKTCFHCSPRGLIFIR